MAATLDGWEGDAVTWVPLSRKRRARRGFDQAELLARALARRLDVPARRLLVRRRDTREQARATAQERRRALRGAFSGVGLVPGRVLLVDDVVTTGSTVAACASTLRRAGAHRVVVAAAARALREPAPARCFGVMEREEPDR
jgi:ComF family protein